MDFSQEQQLIFDKYIQGKNLFITGPGGTGKSFLIKHIYEDACKKGINVDITALTGCAATILECKAKTIHSWGGIGIGTGTIYEIINKIKKNPGDFYLTIKFDKEDLIKEYFAGLRYYGSLQFYKRISSKSDECLFNLVNKFNDLSDEELFDFIKNKENIHKPIKYKGISYNFREELLNQDGNFDYIGNFNDWEKTIKEIKDKTNIDLTSLKEETTKSFKEQKYG